MFRKTVQTVFSVAPRVASRGLMTIKPNVRVAVATFKQTTASFSKLSEVLVKELEYERSQNEVDQEFLDMEKKYKKEFTIQEKVGSSEVVMTRKHKNETITVTFNCQDISEFDDGEEAEDEQSLGVAINFLVEIAKNNEKVLFTCSATDALQVTGIKYTSADKPNDDIEGYAGPNLEDLEEAVQEEIFSYLADRKIDDDLAYFVLSYSREKEQKEYVNWLDKVSNFTA